MLVVHRPTQNECIILSGCIILTGLVFFLEKVYHLSGCIILTGCIILVEILCSTFYSQKTKIHLHVLKLISISNTTTSLDF